MLGVKPCTPRTATVDWFEGVAADDGSGRQHWRLSVPGDGTGTNLAALPKGLNVQSVARSVPAGGCASFATAPAGSDVVAPACVPRGGSSPVPASLTGTVGLTNRWALEWAGGAPNRFRIRHLVRLVVPVCAGLSR